MAIALSSPPGASAESRPGPIGTPLSALAHSTKVKMFGFLKNLLRKAPETSAENYEETSSTAIAEPAATAAPKRPVFKAPPLRRNGPPVNGNGKGIEISLQSIIQGLPLELQPRVRRTDVGDASITVPLEKVLAQLSRGAVKVSFGELRQASPDVFTAQNDRDRVLVCLPLADILSKLNPALIARRRVQRQVEIPPEISSPFDAQGHGLSLSGNSSRKESEAAQPAAAPRQTSPVPPPIAAAPRASLSNVAAVPAPEAPAVPTPPRFSVPATPAAPVPASPTPAPAPAQPTRLAAASSAPAPLAFNPKPILAKPVSPIDPGTFASPLPVSAPISMPVAQAPAPKLPVATPSAPKPAPAPALPAAPKLTVAPAREVAQTPAAAVAPSAPPAKPSGPAPEPLLMSLASLAEAWPDEVRKEVISFGLAEAKVGLPAQAIEQALKQGRICFSWKTIRSWVKPAVPAVTSAHDGAVVDLPLKVVAPLFLERQREANKSKQKVSIDEEIPNLFFGFPQPESSPSPALATARPTDTNYYVWDDSHDTARIHESEVKRGPTPGTRFAAKYATPNEVVSRAAGLEGVAGALIALPDGLMVANRLPPDLNADTLAAFLPQIFGKVSQCTKELRMGDLNNLNFTVGNVPWKIFRVNAIFFAAFGQAGVPLPTAQLAALAAELDHKAK
jgi:predicted regulator of Ras-like GTPase activity (Roadblock/LC7/MglB family)